MRNFNKNNLLHVLALFQLHSIQHPSVPVYIYKYIYKFLINIGRTQMNYKNS